MPTKASGLSLRFGRAIIIAALCGIALFGLLKGIAEMFVDVYVENSGYVEMNANVRAEALQNYVDSNSLSSTDAAMLRAWCDEQPLIFMEVYREGKLAFSSSYLNEEDLIDKDIEARYYEWLSYYTIDFADGPADLLISCNDVYRLRMGVTVAVAAVAFMVFFMVFLLEVRRMARYIRLLSTEIQAMEGGVLDRSVTVRGADELGDLATSLDSMRESILRQRLAEERMYRENQQLVTELSHDLRTPLTKLMLYTEVVRKGKYEDEEHLQKLLDRIDESAGQIKNLADDILHHSLDAKKPSKAMHTVAFEEAFGAEVEMMEEYLESQGFTVETHQGIPNERIVVCDENLKRVFDNVASNIVKHGDRVQTVTIGYSQEKDRVGISVCNAVAAGPTLHESTGVGLNSIASLMEEMNGSLAFKEYGGMFETVLWFRRP